MGEENIIEIELENLYKSLLCPFSGQVMKDPVICRDGISYDRTSVDIFLVENKTLKNVIETVPLLGKIMLKYQNFLDNKESKARSDQQRMQRVLEEIGRLLKYDGNASPDELIEALKKKLDESEERSYHLLFQQEIIDRSRLEIASLKQHVQDYKAELQKGEKNEGQNIEKLMELLEDSINEGEKKDLQIKYLESQLGKRQRPFEYEHVTFDTLYKRSFQSPGPAMMFQLIPQYHPQPICNEYIMHKQHYNDPILESSLHQITQYRVWVERNRKCPQAHFYLGRALVNIRNYEEGAKELEEALKLGFRKVEYINPPLKKAYKALGRFADAQKLKYSN